MSEPKKFLVAISYVDPETDDLATWTQVAAGACEKEAIEAAVEELPEGVDIKRIWTQPASIDSEAGAAAIEAAAILAMGIIGIVFLCILVATLYYSVANCGAMEDPTSTCQSAKSIVESVSSWLDGNGFGR